MFQTRRIRLEVIAVLTLLLSWLLLPVVAQAASVVSQGFKVTEKFATGQAVVMNNGTLAAATASNQAQLYGVVITRQDAVISLSNGLNEVQVVTSGPASVIASDLNGEIKTGDQLVPSPISGVVMKGTEAGKSLGVAQQDMSALSANYQKQSVKMTDGSSKQVNVVLLSVAVNIHDFQPSVPTTPAILLPLQSALSNTVGKQVSTMRLIIALGILVVTIVAVFVILYAAASSSIRSVGRNPTAQSAIFLSLIQVVAIIAVIFAVAFGLIMLVIRG